MFFKKSCFMSQNFGYTFNMKNYIIISLLSVAFVFGFAGASSAQHKVVEKGDSMWKIAEEYNINFHEILRLNKHFLNPHLIHPKDKIEMPDGFVGTSTNKNSASDNITANSKKLTEAGASDQANAVLKLVNAERTKQGLKQLTLSSKLTSVANTKAKDMAVNNYFSHNSPTYGSPFQMMQDFGVTYKSAGENIAAGQRSAQEVMNSWMNSSGHRANILNANFTELGVGYYEGGSYGTYWVQEFIKP